MRMSWRGPRLIAMALSLVTATAASASMTQLTITAQTQTTVLAKTLQSKNATEAAAAAYWLGFRGTDAVPHIPNLIAALGDHRAVAAFAYRHDVAPQARTTPGEEAAGALVRIGKPAVDPLIQALLTSSSSFARQNAAWALGQIDSVERAASVSPSHKNKNY